MIDSIVNSFVQEKGILKHGLILFYFQDAINLINLCCDHNVPILGIDSFKLFDNRIQPFLEHSIDCSNNTKDYKRILDFINSKKNFDFMFEIVIDHTFVEMRKEVK
jgi:hypothetical protein